MEKKIHQHFLQQRISLFKAKAFILCVTGVVGGGGGRIPLKICYSLERENTLSNENMARVKMFNSAQHYLASLAPQVGADLPAPCSARCSSPKRAMGGEAAALEQPLLAPWQEETGPGPQCWVASCMLTSTGLLGPATRVPSARAPAAGDPHAAQLGAACRCHLPSMPAQIHPPRWGTSGSYLNPRGKKGRIPFCQPSFVCALPLGEFIWGPIW